MEPTLPCEFTTRSAPEKDISAINVNIFDKKKPCSTPVQKRLGVVYANVIHSINFNTAELE